jgi:hypothetical protein
VATITDHPSAFLPRARVASVRGSGLGGGEGTSADAARSAISGPESAVGPLQAGPRRPEPHQYPSSALPPTEPRSESAPRARHKSISGFLSSNGLRRDLPVSVVPPGASHVRQRQPASFPPTACVWVEQAHPLVLSALPPPVPQSTFRRNPDRDSAVQYREKGRAPSSKYRAPTVHYHSGFVASEPEQSILPALSYLPWSIRSRSLGPHCRSRVTADPEQPEHWTRPNANVRNHSYADSAAPPRRA